MAYKKAKVTTQYTTDMEVVALLDKLGVYWELENRNRAIDYCIRKCAVQVRKETELKKEKEENTTETTIENIKKAKILREI
jgi:hypothetical protein